MSLDAVVQVRLGDFSLDLALRIAPGEVVAVLGPNGSGKTTLLRALAGLEPLKQGRIVLDGRVLDDPAIRVLVAPEHRSCGMLFQDHVLFPHLSVCENVAYGLRSRGIARGEARRRAIDWLELLELDGLTDAPPAALSGGQAQRVALARTLITEPRMLLLDEPMSSLDVANGGVLRAELGTRLCHYPGCAVLVTHDPLDVAAMADRVVIVEEGRIVQEGTLTEVTTTPGTEYVVELAGALGRVT